MKHRIKWSFVGLAIWLVCTLMLQAVGLSLLTSHLLAGIPALAFAVAFRLARDNKAPQSRRTRGS